mgnify:FL=1
MVFHLREDASDVREQAIPQIGSPPSLQGEVLECEVHEVSINGVRFSSKEPLPPNTVKEMTLDTGEDEKLKVQAAIRWCRPASSGGYEVGAEISFPVSEPLSSTDCTDHLNSSHR